MQELKNIITQKFSINFKWNVAGSSFYEILKITHQVFLLKTMESSAYGLLGSIFSIIYLTIYLSEFGLGSTLPPFLHIFTQNKKSFKELFLKKYFLPQVFIIFSAAIITTILYSKSFLNNIDSPYLLVIPLIIISENLRIFFRRFLHTVFESIPTVITETILMPIYLLLVWFPYLFLNFRMSLNLVFIPYLIDSIVGTILFLILTKRFYKKLPQNDYEIKEKFLYRRILKARIFNYSINASKEFFKGNFLTPFFAYQFGLKDAGIFSLANHIAESIKAIMKATIIFSGAAMLAKFKTFTLPVKQQAFKIIFKKLNLVIYPLMIFIAFNYKFLIKFNKTTEQPSSAIPMLLLFLLIALMEYFFIIYDQFYIVEEQSPKLFLFKVLELSLYYIFIISAGFASPISTLLGIIILRLLSFIIIAGNAYFNWKIKPNFSIPYKYLIAYTIFSLMFRLLFI